jgi:predicted DCC family thiol-disulfide oxidoreductase YuxK
VTDAPLLIFDGDCAFCSSTVRVAQRRIRRLPAAQPYQHTDLAGFGLTAAQCDQAVHYVDGRRRIYIAHDAVAALLRDSGSGWRVLGAVIRIPVVHWLSGVVYRWVARNRHRLPGGTAACSLPGREAAAPPAR